jgi:hypothetical protein
METSIQQPPDKPSRRPVLPKSYRVPAVLALLAVGIAGRSTADDRNDEGKAQDQDDLQPESGPYVDSGTHPLDVVLSSLLLPDYGSERLCTMVVKGSGPWQEAVFIVKNEETDKFAVILRRVNNSALKPVRESLGRAIGSGQFDWSPTKLAEAVRSVNATVTTKTTGIDGAVVKVLADAWTRVLVRVKYASRARTAQDGTTYHFGHRAGMRALAGTTSTPRKGTVPAQLVALGESLMEYAEAGSPALARQALQHVEQRARELRTHLDAVDRTGSNDVRRNAAAKKLP